MQHPDDNTGDHRTEDPGVDRLDPKNALMLLAFRTAASRVGRMPLLVNQKFTARFITVQPTKPANAARSFVFKTQRDGCIQNMTGKKLKANEPILLIQVAIAL